MKTIRRVYLQVFISLLVISLLFPGSALAGVTALDEVRELLRSDYFEPVPADVLNSPSIEVMLKKLDDPHTNFLSAADYQDFNDSLEQTFSGIGIYFDVVAEGVKITGLIKGSPSETAGLQTGDIVTSAGGYSLQGLSSEEAIPLIRGPKGSKVQLTIMRAGKTFSTRVERNDIEVPTVNDELKPNNIGYLRISTFGFETGDLFGNCLEKLRSQNPSAYIVDLRDNGGGYVNAALDIAGYFIGDKVAIQTQYREGPASLDHAENHSYLVDKPTLFLINENSASASEILAGAIKDYNKALIIGTQSYGKGSMQQLYSLDSGDYFKMTVAHFLSPLGQQINHKGITPDLLIEQSDALKVAELLLSDCDTSGDTNGLVKFDLAAYSIVIDTHQAREPEYWQAYGEIMDRVGLGIMKGRPWGWENVSNEERSALWSLYYPDYQYGNDLKDVPLDKKFTLHFPRSVDWATANKTNIELIDVKTGERVPLDFEPLSSTELQAAPSDALLPAATYWLVLHPGIKYEDMSILPTGILYTVNTSVIK